MKAVRTDQELECPGIDAGLRARGVDLVTLPDGIPEAELCAAVADADLILMCYTPVTSRVIAAAANLKGIVKYGVGIDALAKRLPAISGAIAREGWVWPQARWLGQDISGKTVGLVGFGKIGRSMARMAGLGFNARVCAFDPNVDAATMQAAGVDKSDDLRAMLAASDFVSIHCVLNDATRYLIGAAELAAMKPSAVLINVSRGAIVDEAALLEAIVAGGIAGAGLDVYSIEPLQKLGHLMSPLFGRDNVILFPHLTFFTHEAMQRLEDDTLARCFEILDSRPVTVRSHDPRLRAQTSGVVFR
jgi:D-3-phosphoglycerate dehydrogenase